jgi:hypothetical protein
MSIRWKVKRLIALDSACSPAIQQIYHPLRLFIPEYGVHLASPCTFFFVVLIDVW